MATLEFWLAARDYEIVEFREAGKKLLNLNYEPQTLRDQKMGKETINEEIEIRTAKTSAAPRILRYYCPVISLHSPGKAHQAVLGPDAAHGAVGA